jgi:serine/threonine protein kinase
MSVTHYESLERDFFDEYYDLHRRDAMAMERLTHSQYVLDIYGYCGQSALNELAHFAGGMSSLEDLAKSLKNNYKSEVNSYRLQVAAMIALGLAHVHEIDGRDRASLVHYDMNPRNIAIVKSGKPKLNDFNVAEFLRWDTALNQSCGFAGRLHEPWWRAPEEMIIPGEQGALDAPRLNEKVDVYAFGNILQKFLTGHMPRGRIEKDRAAVIRAQVLEGHPPPMSSFFRKSKDPAIVAMRDAIALCLKPDPNERGSSREVATILMKGVKKLKAKGLV